MTSPQEKNNSLETSEFQENLEILRQTYFFSGVPIEKLKIFAYICKRETFEEDEYLFRQDENDGRAFYILKGKANLYYDGDDGEEFVRDFKEGEFLAGSSLLSDAQRLFSLKASSEMGCLIMSRDKFNSAIKQFPDIMPIIARSLVDRINSWEGRFIDERTEGCQICRHKLGVSVV